MSDLNRFIDEYLATRRALGFTLEREARLLPDFAEFLHAAGTVTVTTEMALQWATAPQGTHRNWHSARLGIVRVFARWLAVFDPDAQVPPADLLPSVFCV